eukprot:315070_1
MAQDIQPDIMTLVQTLDRLSDEDGVTIILPFIECIDNFAPSEKAAALTMLRNIFWSKQSGQHYEFTNCFKLLTAQNLSIILQRIGTKEIEQFIFNEHNNKYLPHYPVQDLLFLLQYHYSDAFANFVFLQFKGGFLKAKLTLRIRYFKIISVRTIIEILKNGGVGKSLTNDELIIITIQVKNYLTSNHQSIDITDNTWLDCQSILPEIIEVMIGDQNQNLKSLTVQNLQTMLDNDLIVNMNQAKNIVRELLTRQRKLQVNMSTNNTGNIITNCERLIGTLSTDNFACFQRSITHTDNVTLNAHVTLDGPLVVMPFHEQDSDPQDILNYSVLIQIQDLNPLFNTKQRNSGAQPSQPDGSIFIVLLQAIPSNYEVVLFVSNYLATDRSKIKELNLGINNKNPICVISWPLPQIGRIGRFRLHAQLRPIQRDIKKIEFGIQNMFSSDNAEHKSNSNQEVSSSNHGHTWSRSGNNMVMCIYSGSRSGLNQDRLSWINVIINRKMTFRDMIDSAAAQLGLPPAIDNTTQTSVWSSFRQQESQVYVVRNQMGHTCPMNEIVMQYLDRMMNNSNLFPVFIFAQTAKPQQPTQNNLSFGNLNFNPSTGDRNAKPFTF